MEQEGSSTELAIWEGTVYYRFGCTGGPPGRAIAAANTQRLLRQVKGNRLSGSVSRGAIAAGDGERVLYGVGGADIARG